MVWHILKKRIVTIHRDLAASSILVRGDLVCKITGFSLARVLEEDKDEYECTSVPKFCFKWTAPEAIMFNRFSTKSDMWSLGILLYEIITYGRFPYPGMTNFDVLQTIQEGYRSYALSYWMLNQIIWGYAKLLERIS